MGKLTRVRKQLCRYICVGLVVAVAPMALSCYGHFPMTKAVYRTNGNIGRSIGEDATGHKLVQSVVMWVMVIVPVYGVAMIGDAVVLNLIEFWTGNVVEVGSVEEHNGNRVALQSTDGGREAVLTISRDGKLLSEQHVIKVSPTAFEMRDASGKLTGSILKTPAGGIQLANAQGQIIQTLAAVDLAALPRR